MDSESIVFPQPLSPTMPSVLPFLRSRLTPSTAFTVPSGVEKCVCRPSIERRISGFIKRLFTAAGSVIAGNFKRDINTGEVIGWGSAFLVQEALSRLGFNGNLEEGNRLPADILPNFIGKSFYRLSYVSGVKGDGKFRYTDWNQIASLDEGIDNLASRFRRSLSKGYPRNYHPDLVDGGLADITVSAPVEIEEDSF